MAEQPITLSDIRHHQYLMEELELSYRDTKKKLAKVEEDLGQRRFKLERAITSEVDNFRGTLYRLGITEREGDPFLLELDNLRFQSHQEFRHQKDKLQDKLDEEKQTFTRRWSQMEEILEELRRKYASSDT